MIPIRSAGSSRVVNVEDFRPLARRRLPKVVFDYLDGGAEGELTLRANCLAFEELTFRPRHAVPSARSGSGPAPWGWTCRFPAMLAPVGYSR
jgi:isopentenyl diphosphate isomerase/L-lactate dehydrogenase-like FMN-dependent dehydrogenase